VRSNVKVMLRLPWGGASQVHTTWPKH
jgi:hypothetical protein